MPRAGDSADLTAVEDWYQARILHMPLQHPQQHPQIPSPDPKSSSSCRGGRLSSYDTYQSPSSGPAGACSPYPLIDFGDDGFEQSPSWNASLLASLDDTNQHFNDRGMSRFCSRPDVKGGGAPALFLRGRDWMDTMAVRTRIDERRPQFW